MRAARAPNTSATAVWPTMTSGQVQMPSGPDDIRTLPYVVKMPVVIEMNEKPIANEAKRRSERSNSCLYPNRSTVVLAVSCTMDPPSGQPACAAGCGSVGAIRMVAPDPSSPETRSGSAWSSVMTAVIWSSGQTRRTAISPSLLESART